MPRKQPREYTGPSATPPAESLVGAIGWRHTKVQDGEGRWKPDGFQIIFSDHILTLNLEGMATIDSAIWKA